MLFNTIFLQVRLCYCFIIHTWMCSNIITFHPFRHCRRTGFPLVLLYIIRNSSYELSTMYVTCVYTPLLVSISDCSWLWEMYGYHTSPFHGVYVDYTVIATFVLSHSLVYHSWFCNCKIMQDFRLLLHTITPVGRCFHPSNGAIEVSKRLYVDQGPPFASWTFTNLSLIHIWRCRRR